MAHFRGQPSNPFGGFWTRGVVSKLVIINIAVFIIEILLSKTNFIVFLGLSPRLVLTRGFVWQLITYMFLHGGFWHLTLNMFIIWMFGSQLEAVWGGERFLKYYIICGIGGALFSFIFAYNTLVIGASGAPTPRSMYGAYSPCGREPSSSYSRRSNSSAVSREETGSRISPISAEWPQASCT